jgi:hypothetical protein
MITLYACTYAVLLPDYPHDDAIMQLYVFSHFLHIATSKMSLNFSKQAYNLVFRRTSTTAVAVLVGAFVFERLFDPTLDAYFFSLNKGVS